MHDAVAVATQFIGLSLGKVMYLFAMGFVGGLVSGFIGSGGAFVLTPGMMSIGVPGLMAVATNMCHKFPKALVGALKRAKYGQVDVKLGIVLGVSAEAGVLYGASVQEGIKKAYGDAGSNLYVSTAFVLVLAIVGGFVMRDAIKSYRAGTTNDEEKLTKIARWVQSVNIPYTMVYFKALNARISVLFTIPLGFATGILAATIAVGGFVGVPSMMYVLGAPGLMASATELVIAFVMGVGGSLKYAMHGMVDIRLALIILAGSLFGIQLGAIGTTYVRPYMIKMVMGVIMVTVLFSRLLMLPNTSFAIMIFALGLGAFIVLKAMWQGRCEERLRERAAELAVE